MDFINLNVRHLRESRGFSKTKMAILGDSLALAELESVDPELATHLKKLLNS